METLRNLKDESSVPEGAGLFFCALTECAPFRQNALFYVWFGEQPEEVHMKCECCKGDMLEEQLVVVGGVVRIKGVSAWHCLQCGRLEYRNSRAEPNMVPVEAKH